MEPEKLNELLYNLLLASIVILIIMLPKFCFRVNDKDRE